MAGRKWSGGGLGEKLSGECPIGGNDRKEMVGGMC